MTEHRDEACLEQLEAREAVLFEDSVLLLKFVQRVGGDRVDAAPGSALAHRSLRVRGDTRDKKDVVSNFEIEAPIAVHTRLPNILAFVIFLGA